MSLSEVKLSETSNETIEEISDGELLVDDILGTDNIETSTELLQVGRILGEADNEQNISKETILNQNVWEGVDLEYQILEGVGVKEEIIIRSLESYAAGCEDSETGCEIPLNEFVFDLQLDEGVELHQSLVSVEDNPVGTYYFTDSQGKYLAHFLPSFAFDDGGSQTNNVIFTIEGTDTNRLYKVHVVLDIDWMLSTDRVFPLHIDPSIVHDDSADFSTGILNRLENATGPKIQLVEQELTTDEHTVGLWHMDEDSGSTVYDSSGNDNDGVTGITIATGGTVTYSGGYTIHEFTSSGTFTVNTDMDVEVLVVAGGGGGGGSNGAGGGGGAGGFLYDTEVSVTTQAYTITVGGGGAGSGSTSGSGTNGSDSSFGSLVTATGGGGGGGYNGSSTTAPSVGGSGGGGGSSGSGSFSGAAGISGQGYAGGNGRSASTSGQAGGGGGGASEVGVNSTSTTGGDGGDGLSCSITGSSVVYAGGGAGSKRSGGSAGLPGAGGGGSTGVGTAGGDGTDGLGGGGGGGSAGNSGGDGGDGVVIIRYLTPSSEVNSVEGKIGNGMSFDGSSDYIKINDSTSLDLTNNFTLEAWVYRDTDSGTYERIISKSETDDYDYWLQIDDTDVAQCGVTIAAGTSRSITGIQTIPTEKWTHIACTFDSSNNWLLYINGVMDSNTSDGTAGPARTSTRDLQIGRLGSGGLFYYNFDGTIDEVRISNTARTPEEIKVDAQKRSYGIYISEALDLTADVTSIDDLQWIESGVSTGDGETPFSSTNLVGEWDLNETSGTTADNEGSCGSSCDGTLVNMVTTGQDDDFDSGWTSNNRKWGAGSLMFDGSNDYINLGTDSSINLTTYTVSGWFRTSNDSDYKVLVNKGTDTSARNIWITIWKEGGGTHPDGSLVWRSSIGGVADEIDLSSGFNVADGKWHYFAAVLDGASEAKLYVDGILVDSDSSISTVDTPSTSTIIGNDPNVSGRYFDGIIDTIQIYSRTLSSSEILSNYNATNIEFLTRTSADGINWEEWMPTSGETQLDSMDDNPDSTDYYTKSLLHFNGSDESTTFTDESGKTWTADGVALDTDQKKFGIASGYFDGGELDTGDTDDFQLDDQDDSKEWTIDFWVRFDGDPSGTTQGIFQYYNSSSNFLALLYDDDSLLFNVVSSGSNTISISNTWDPATATWYHVAVVKQGTTGYKMFVDGTQIGSTQTDTDVIPDCSGGYGAWLGGYYYGGWYPLNGWLDEFRVSKGIARWTDSFTIPAYQYNSDSSINISTDTVVNTEGTGSEKIDIGALRVDLHTVALWHLDETNGDNAGVDVFDETTNNNDGEFTGSNIASAVVEGISGKARDFNGTDDYILIGASSDFDLQNLTIESWVYSSSFSTDSGFIFEKTTNGSFNTQYSSFFDSTDVFYFRTYNSSDVPDDLTFTTSTYFKDNEWNHIACTYDGSDKKVYVNGVQVATKAYTQTLQTNPAGTSIIGAYGSGTSYWFDGKIDEVRISDIARTSEEIYEAYRLGKNHTVSTTISSNDISSSTKLPFWIAADRPGTYLDVIVGESKYASALVDNDTVGYWRMEEEDGIGAYIRDSSAYAHDADPTNTTFVPGKIGMARDFDGSGDYLTISHHTDYNITTNLTLEAWINPDTMDSVGSWNRIIEKGTNNQYGLSVTSDSGYGLILRLYGTTTVTTLSYFVPPLNQWTHVAAVYDGSTVKFYANGVLVSSSSNSGSITTTSNDLVIGDWTSHSRGFDGTIDEVRVSKVARTANEIRQSYEIGLRTHSITIDFAAGLDSGGTGALVTGSSDKLLTIDATGYGLSEQGSALYEGDIVILRENVSGTTYVAQGEVKSVTPSDGEVEVYSWDGDSTFPSGGFTVNATVFKWQREYFDITEPMGNQLDAVTEIIFKVTNGHEGRHVWVDDIEKNSSYLTAPSATSNVSSTVNRYIQYMGVLTSRDTNLTPYISNVTLNYTATSGPTNDQLMRHGKWFNSTGQEQSFWWAD